MYYCSHCLQLQEKPVCASCGAAPLYAPHPKDFCLLMEKGAMWADMLRQVLRDEGIPCVHQPVLGAAMAMNVGAALERHRLYVPYEYLDAARDLAAQLFSAPEETVE